MLIGIFVNQYLFWGRLIRHMFVFKERGGENDTSYRGQGSKAYINFEFSDKFSHCKYYLYQCFCCCRGSQETILNRRQQLYQKGYTKICTELDVMTMIKTNLKLKAGLAAVIRNDRVLTSTAKRIYYSNQTLYLDSEEELQRKCQDPKNCFLEFLNDDDTFFQMDRGGSLARETLSTLPTQANDGGEPFDFGCQNGHAPAKVKLLKNGKLNS